MKHEETHQVDVSYTISFTGPQIVRQNALRGNINQSITIIIFEHLSSVKPTKLQNWFD